MNLVPDRSAEETTDPRVTGPVLLDPEGEPRKDWLMGSYAPYLASLPGGRTQQRNAPQELIYGLDRELVRIGHLIGRSEEDEPHLEVMARDMLAFDLKGATVGPVDADDLSIPQGRWVSAASFGSRVAGLVWANDDGLFVVEALAPELDLRALRYGVAIWELQVFTDYPDGLPGWPDDGDEGGGGPPVDVVID